MDNRQRGKMGESIALEFLNKKNYAIVTTGFRSRFGEIDLIMKNKEFLVFVEVKTRKNASFAYAREYVNKKKQRKIIATANYWLMKRPTKLQPRFDVIEIYTEGSETAAGPEINHIENAFGAG
jgi:putative endonuclease